jgi:DNA-binding response OmpR family regulator
MPQLSGIELVRAVRRDPALRDLPVLMLSGDTDLDHRQAAHEAGADEILPKPIAPVQLKARAEAQLERLRLTRMAEQRHGVTGLPLPARTMRDGELVVEAMHREGRHAVVAVLLPVELPRGDRDAARWLREVARIAALLPDARFLGHHEGDGLLADVARDAGAGGEVVHRWRPQEAMLAPDVVVVEDDADLSAMLQYALRAAGFSFRAFTNGRLALDHLLAMKVQGKRPFVLLDVDLPGMDGYSATRCTSGWPPSAPAPSRWCSSRCTPASPTSCARCAAGPWTTSPSPSTCASSWRRWPPGAS